MVARAILTLTLLASSAASANALAVQSPSEGRLCGANVLDIRAVGESRGALDSATVPAFLDERVSLAGARPWAPLGDGAGHAEAPQQPLPVATKHKRRHDDSCEYAKDGECDEPDYCDPGTDTTDCRADAADDDDGDEPGGQRENRDRGRSCCMFNGGRCGPFTDQPAYPVGEPCSCQYGNPNAGGKVCKP